MGVHQMRKRPMVVDGEIKIRDIMYLSLSFDHRVIDGADGARFLRKVSELLSDPLQILMQA